MPDRNRSRPARSQARRRRRTTRKPKMIPIGAGLNPETGLGADLYQLLSISADLNPEPGLGTDPHRHRWLDIDAGGRPRRKEVDDAISRDLLLAALQGAPVDELRGRRGRPTADACERYLEVTFPRMSRAIIRNAVKMFISRARITGRP